MNLSFSKKKEQQNPNAPLSWKESDKVPAGLLSLVLSGRLWRRSGVTVGSQLSLSLGGRRRLEDGRGVCWLGFVGGAKASVFFFFLGGGVAGGRRVVEILKEICILEFLHFFLLSQWSFNIFLPFCCVVCRKGLKFCQSW